MYHIAIMFTQVFFYVFMICFLYMGVKYIGVERGKINGSRKKGQVLQFCMVIFNFMAGFFVMYFSGNYENLIIDFGIFIGGYIIIKIIFPLVYRGSCPLLLNSVLFLTSVSLIFLYRLNPELSMQLFKFIILGFSVILILPLAFRVVPKIDRLNIIYFIASLIILLLPTIYNNSSAYGSNNWVQIGSLTFQPSEIVKFTFVFYLASFLDKEFNFRRLVYVTASSGILIIILAMQNDFGGALIFFMTFMTLLFVRTGSISLFLAGITGVSFFAVIAYNIASHIQLRVAIWQNPWASPYGDGFQIVQSLLAIGSYAPFGSGLTNGYPQSVPIIESDFIFSGISEEFGAVYGLLLLCVFIVAFYRCINIALRTEKSFHSLLVVGFTSLLAFQTFVIIGGVTKLIPLTGVTLPFVSYGGTSMFASILMFGIIQLICTYNAKKAKVKTVIEDGHERVPKEKQKKKSKEQLKERQKDMQRERDSQRVKDEPLVDIDRQNLLDFNLEELCKDIVKDEEDGQN